MNTNYTYEQIANDYNLWTEFVDVDGNMSRETFDSTPVNELVAIMIDMFGLQDETPVYTVNLHNGHRATVAAGVWINGIPDGITQDEADDIMRSIANGAVYGNGWTLHTNPIVTRPTWY